MPTLEEQKQELENQLAAVNKQIEEQDQSSSIPEVQDMPKRIMHVPNPDEDKDDIDIVLVLTPADEEKGIEPMWVMDTPVTQKLYEAVMGTNPAYFKDHDQAPQLPVECVSYYDAQEFIYRLNKLLDLKGKKAFKLPTADQSEYFTRAGTTTKYWWGNEPNPACAVYNASSPAPVRSKHANPWGLYDTAGNVWEWVDSVEEEDE